MPNSVDELEKQKKDIDSKETNKDPETGKKKDEKKKEMSPCERRVNKCLEDTCNCCSDLFYGLTHAL